MILDFRLPILDFHELSPGPVSARPRKSKATQHTEPFAVTGGWVSLAITLVTVMKSWPADETV
jgi:hypothetical protein